VTPPVWRDQHGHPLPMRPCPRCGSVVAVHRYAPGIMRMLGWRPWGEAAYVNWCGHTVEVVLIPEADGWCSELPILGEAA